MAGRYYTELLDVLRAAGVAVAVDDVNAGWETRARSSGGFAEGFPLGIVFHHTASSATPYSDLSYMCHGSDDAPIGNVLLDRNGVVWPIAGGCANTQGKGGPVTLSRGTVPIDAGNSQLFAIEAANSGTGESWPAGQIDAYYRTSNALNALFGNQPTDVITHALNDPPICWTSRKVDPATAAAVRGPWVPAPVSSSGTWSIDDIRAECARRAATTPPPQPPPSEEDYDMTFLIQNNADGGAAVVYGDGKVTGVPDHNLAGFTAKFGAPMPVDPEVFADFANKGRD